LMDEAKAEVLAFTAFPRAHWSKIWSTDESVNAAHRMRLRHDRGSTAPARPSLRDSAARSRGQGGAPGWTNDLDRGEDRGSVEGRWAWSTAKRRAGIWDCNPCHAA
jgi:hypothetical protein